MKYIVLVLCFSFSCFALEYDEKWQLIDGEWQLQPIEEPKPPGALAVMKSNDQLDATIVIRMASNECKKQQDTAKPAGTMIWGDDYRGTRELDMMMMCTGTNEVTLFPATKDGAKYIWDSFMSGTSRATGSAEKGGQEINLLFESLNFLDAGAKFIDSERQ